MNVLVDCFPKYRCELNRSKSGLLQEGGLVDCTFHTVCCYYDDRVLGLPGLPLNAEEHQDMNDSHYQQVNYLSDVVTHVGVSGLRVARVKREFRPRTWAFCDLSLNLKSQVRISLP